MKLISNTFVQSLDSGADILTILDNLRGRLDDNDSFFVCKLPEIIDKCLLWRSMFPRVKPYYGVNANSSCIVMETLAALGVGFDCTTKKNLVQALGAVPANSIYLSSRLQTEGLLKYAAGAEIALLCFDNKSELEKLKKCYPDANLLIVVKTSSDEKYSFDFGCDANAGYYDLLKMARSLNMNVVGIQFDIEPKGHHQPYSKAIQLAKELFDVGSKLGFNLNLLSLGSGFPIDALNETAEEINTALDDHFPGDALTVIANPAQFFVESAYTLTCQVEYVREVEREDAETGTTYTHYEYYINDGVFGSFNSVLCDKQNFNLQPLNKYPKSKTFSSSIWGPTCTNLDQIVEEVSLPAMNVGDAIIFNNMGFYTASAHSGFPLKKVYIVSDDEVWLRESGEQHDTKEVYFVMGNQTELMKAQKRKQDPTERPDTEATVDGSEIIQVEYDGIQ
ncbi:ornithine decarboxylase 1-like [Coccinella septempunctata]|uniref:ornithine decarboxylase 1-like n=1 Tax=Coccinella septempunctata TaxID=41139 RepID=UPI001D09598F|nr:ornithine decarboxylase 1-like [Coccinella septempunctata]